MPSEMKAQLRSINQGSMEKLTFFVKQTNKKNTCSLNTEMNTSDTKKHKQLLLLLTQSMITEVDYRLIKTYFVQFLAQYYFMTSNHF